MAEKPRPNRMRQTFSADEPETVTDKVGGLVHNAVDAVKHAFTHDEEPVTDKSSEAKKKPVQHSEKHKDIKQHSKFDKFKKGHLNGNE